MVSKAAAEDGKPGSRHNDNKHFHNSSIMDADSYQLVNEEEDGLKEEREILNESSKRVDENQEDQKSEAGE